MGRRRGQLVCQHLENVSHEVLNRYPEIVRAFARQRYGIYALYRKNRLYYVGLASNLPGRLRRHLRDRHAQTWDRFSMYLTIGDRHLREIESLLLRIAKPRGNRVAASFSRSENLRADLRRAISEHHRREMDIVLGRTRAKEKGARRRAVKPAAEPGGPKIALAAYVTKGFPIRFRYRGKVHIASVRRDGRIRLKGRLFNSPSGAAEAITKHGVSGWNAWQYQRAPGDWVPLSYLRK